MVLVFAMMLAFFETPNAALAPELTRDYDERSKLEVARVLRMDGRQRDDRPDVLLRVSRIYHGGNSQRPVQSGGVCRLRHGRGKRDVRRNRGLVAGDAWQISRLVAPPVRKISLGTVFKEMFVETLANKSMGAIFLTAIIANTALGLGQSLSVYMSAFFGGSCRSRLR